MVVWGWLLLGGLGRRAGFSGGHARMAATTNGAATCAVLLEIGDTTTATIGLVLERVLAGAVDNCHAFHFSILVVDW